MIDPMLFSLVMKEVSAAPSVHNIQPARWSLEDGAMTLWRDEARRLPVGDPTGRDVGVSLGASCEAAVLALSRWSRAASVEMLDGPVGDGVAPVCRITSAMSCEPDPLADAAISRSSHRSSFDPASAADRSAAGTLASRRVAVLAREDQVGEVASMVDASSLGFMRDPAFRRELRGWMRLTRLDRRWRVDGLNAAAMGMGTLEALGAGAVLGPLFRPLDAMGALAPLLSDRTVTAGSAAIVVLHRARGTATFDVGRSFMRAWLSFEAEGFRGAVVASVVDDPVTRARLAGMCGIPASRSVEAAWRIGRSSDPRHDRARLPIGRILVRRP